MSKKVREFYNENYSSDIMCLTILTNKSSSEIEEIVRANYSEIKKREIKHKYYDVK